MWIFKAEFYADIKSEEGKFFLSKSNFWGGIGHFPEKCIWNNLSWCPLTIFCSDMKSAYNSANFYTLLSLFLHFRKGILE